MEIHWKTGECYNIYQEEIKKAKGKDVLWEQIETDVKGPTWNHYIGYKCLTCDLEFTGNGAPGHRDQHFVHDMCQAEYEAQKENRGENVFWKKIKLQDPIKNKDGTNSYSVYKCLKCDDVVYIKKSKMEHHMEIHHIWFNDVHGGCEVCGLHYSTRHYKHRHELRKKRGIACRFVIKNGYIHDPNAKPKESDELKKERRKQRDRIRKERFDKLQSLTTMERFELCFGPRKFNCNCGFVTNDEDSYNRHISISMFTTCTAK